MGWDVGGGVEVGDDDNSSSSSSERDRDDYDEDHDDGRDPYTGERNGSSSYDREERDRDNNGWGSSSSSSDSDKGWWDKVKDTISSAWESSKEFTNDKKEYDSASDERKRELENKYRESGEYGKLSLLKETKEEREEREKSNRHSSADDQEEARRRQERREKELASLGAAVGIVGNANLGTNTSSTSTAKPAPVDPNEILSTLNVGRSYNDNTKKYTADCDISVNYHAGGFTTVTAPCDITIEATNIFGIGSTNVGGLPSLSGSTTVGTTISMSKSELDNGSAITSGTCTTENICVPNLNIPDTVRNIVDGTDETKATEKKKLIEDVDGIAARISGLVDYALSAPEQPFNHQRYHSEFNKPDLANYLAQLDIAIPDKQADYPDLSQFLDAPFPEHTFQEFNLDEDKSMLDALKKLDDLLKEPTDVEEKVTDLTNDTLTERIVDGRGTFDWLASAMMNQLDMARKKELIDKSELANVYTQSMIGVLQTASQFVLERDKTYWANLLVRSQMIQANVQALLAKAQLITLPIQVKLQYAQLHAELQKLKLMGYQIESEKVRIKQTEAQTDQILVQTDGMQIANELAQVQLQDATMKLALTNNQIKNSALQNEELQVKIQDQKLKLELGREQVVQTQEQTKQLTAQTEQIVEATKLTNSQWQKTLKEVKLVDANILEMEAKIKLMAQQTEKELNQVDLIKGQVAEAYSRIALLGEQIKAAKAQYSDTIDGKPVKGIIGTQNALHRKQSLSYDRDSLYKVMQLQSNGWQVKKTADIGTKSPAAFTAASLDGMLQEYLGTYYNTAGTAFPDFASNALHTANGAGSGEVYGRVDMSKLKPVPNYRDYVSDEEMDNKNEPTKVGNTAAG